MKKILKSSLIKISRIVYFSFKIFSKIKFYILPDELKKQDEFKKNSLLQKLKNEAVWLIIDPWKVQPKLIDDEYVKNINNYYCNKIDEYMCDVKNKFVVLNENETVHEIFRDYPRIQHKFVNDEIKDKFTTIVYVGFHHGRCTIDKPGSGAKYMYQIYKIYFIENLLCLLPGDSWIEMDKKTKKYGEII